MINKDFSNLLDPEDESEPEGYRMMKATHRYIVNTLIDDFKNNKRRPNDKRINAGLYRSIIVIRELGIQDKQVSEGEAEEIRLLRRHGFSMDLLAYVFNRSKSTIFHHTRKLDQKE